MSELAGLRRWLEDGDEDDGSDDEDAMEHRSFVNCIVYARSRDIASRHDEASICEESRVVQPPSSEAAARKQFQ